VLYAIVARVPPFMGASVLRRSAVWGVSFGKIQPNLQPLSGQAFLAGRACRRDGQAGLSL